MHLIPTSLFEPATPVTIREAAVVTERSFDEKVLAAVEVIKCLIRNGKHLVVACSFGKDSSVTLALTLRAMSELKTAGFEVPELSVMNSDTLMENPSVHIYSKSEISVLKAYAKAKDLPVRVWVCRPNLSENWLTSIIGGRTVASLPGNSAKCQQQLKKAPLDRTKRQIKAVIKQKVGAAYKEEDVIVLIGTRRDESAVRERNMEARGESAYEPVNMASEGEKPSWVLSPIADFTTMDIFTFLGRVTNGRFETYSDFQQLTEIYRDSAGGECMVNVFMREGGVERRTACGSRHGCWGCLRVSTDRSMEQMLAEETGKHAHMRPLNAFRNYLGARHYDPAARNWLARSINPDNGYIKIAANAYSPDFCLELLRYALTIDADEAEWSMRTGEAARFQILGMREVLAIDLQWARYSYQKPFTALAEYKAIFEDGKRYYIPEEYKAFTRSDLDVSKSVEVPFADEHFNGFYEGLRSVTAAAAGCKSVIKKNGVYYTNVNESTEYDLDAEAVELFYEFELERALEYYGPHADVAPSEAVHYLARFGVVSFKKGGHSEWDRMLRIGNQLHRLGLRDILNNPEALIAKLTGAAKACEVVLDQVAEQQLPLMSNCGQYLMDL